MRRPMEQRPALRRIHARSALLGDAPGSLDHARAVRSTVLAGKPLRQPGHGCAPGHCPQLARRQVKQLPVPLVRKDEPLLAVVHRDGVFGGVEHGFQIPTAVGELRPDGRDLPFHVPLGDERQRDLLDLLAGERLPDVQQLGEQPHVVGDVGQRLVGVCRHDDDLDLAVDGSHPADRLYAVDARRHSHVDVGDRYRLATLPCRRDDRAALLAARGVQQIELRKSGLDARRHEAVRQLVRPQHAAALQHPFEVLVDLLLVVDDQHPGVAETSDAGHQAFSWSCRAFGASGIRNVTRMVVPRPTPSLRGSMLPPVATA